MKQADCEDRHFALCKNNQTHAPGALADNTIAGTDIRYTEDQARRIYEENGDLAGELPIGPGTAF